MVPYGSNSEGRKHSKNMSGHHPYLKSAPNSLRDLKTLRTVLLAFQGFWEVRLCLFGIKSSRPPQRHVPEDLIINRFVFILATETIT